MKNIFRKLALGLGLAIAAITAHADIVTPLVSLQENFLYYENGEWRANQYVLTVNSDNKNDMVHAFGVTNPLYQNAWTTREGWQATVLSREEWNAGRLFQSPWCYDSGCANYETGSGGLAGETESMILGSFESIFGPAENYVNFYWNETGGAIGLESRNSSDEFYFSAPPASEYAAFGNGGMLVYRSYNVPEPGALALIGLAALAALSATRRRRPD